MNADDQDWSEFLAAARTFKPWPRLPAAAAPDAVPFSLERNPLGRADLRRDGILSTAKDQGKSGSCTSFALAAAAEAEHRKVRGRSITLAPWFIHTCVLNLDPDEGEHALTAIPKVVQRGIATTSDSNSPFNRCDTQDVLKIKGWNTVDDANSAKLTLDDGHAVVAALFVDFESFVHVKNGVYDYQPDDKGNLHSVCMVGYDDTRGEWLVLNSQGRRWGMGGVGRVAYGSCALFERYYGGPGLRIKL